MKTQMRQTSIDTYHDLDLNNQQREVLAALKRSGCSCIADLAARMGWQRSTVSGRMNDLKKAGLLVYAGKFKSKATGITSEFWTAV